MKKCGVTMRKICVSSLLILLIMCAVISCKKNEQPLQQMRIAVITTSSVNDKSYNQDAYEVACEFAEKHNAVCKNFVTAGVQTDVIADTFSHAASEHYNVFILMGYACIKSLILSAAKYPNVIFVGIDINDLDIYTLAENLGLTSYKIPKNVYCCSFHEHFAGFLAGYAAVREGFTHLGFIGGKAVPAVVRYGLGYVQGINLAALEMGITENVIVEYAYSKSFEETDSITEEMRQWFSDGVEVVFPCGGGSWGSAAKAAAEYDKRIIGVDTDQSEVINAYKSDMCLTSAEKNIGRSVRYMLEKIQDNQFGDFGGKAETLGMVSADDPDLNFLQLPTDTWTMKKFTQDDYRQLVRRIVNGEIIVSGSADEKQNYSVTLNIRKTVK